MIPATFDKQVAPIAHGFDFLGVVGVVAQFAAEARNRYVNAAIHTIVVYSPQRFKQGIAA